DRLVAETAFALPATVEEDKDGRIVHADIFEAALSDGENPNDLLVAHAMAILRLDQYANVAHVRLIDGNGAKTLHLDAEKRIPRANATPTSLAMSNRSTIDAVAQAVSGESWSEYLSRGEALLRRGHSAFQRLIDSVLVDRFDQN